MNQYKYILEPYKGMKTRHDCPSCGGKKTFTRFINTETGEYLSDKVGRCDREDKCQYIYTPKSFFLDNPECNNPGVCYTVPNVPRVTGVTGVTGVTKPLQYLPIARMDASVINCGQSNLFPFLQKLFRTRVAVELCHNYFIGASDLGNTIFWQVDIDGNIRQAKVIRYNPETGKRSHAEGSTFFVGKKILKDEDANLRQCFFGEYLLSMDENKNKPVAIVESEKTAVIASIYYPQFVWLATGGKNGARWTEQSVCKVLAGKKVILFPDLGAFDNWKAKGLLLSATACCKVAVSDQLEKYATHEEKKQGYDIADFLLRKQDSSGLALTDYEYPVIWN